MAQKAKDQDLSKAFVGSDDKAAGSLETRQALEVIGGKGSIALLYGHMGSDGQLLRKEGYGEVLKEFPEVTVVFEQTANWDTAEALTVTENWLSTGTEINAVVSQNDSLAIGVLKPVANASKTDSIKVFGVDATDDGLSSITSGGMSGTVSQDTAGMGELAVSTMRDLLNGKQVEPINYTEATWITKDNVDTVKKVG